MLHSVISHELHGLLYIMSALLIYLVLTPFFLYKDKKRKVLFAFILIIVSYFYLEYEDIDPFVFSLQLAPVCLVLAILFEESVPAIFTWIIFNFCSIAILRIEWLPTLISSTVLLAGGLYITKSILKFALGLKLVYATVMFMVYDILYVIFASNFRQQTALYIIYTIFISYLSIWFMTFIISYVKKQEFHSDKFLCLEKDRMIGQLAASVSHEIRNPLASARGFLQLLDKKNCTFEESKQYISYALSGIDQANTIITEYLNYAKPGSNEQVQLNIKEELDAVIRFISPLAMENSILIQITHNCHDPLYVRGESKKLRQCFMNLVKNAIESMPGGGSLSIQTSKLGETVQISFSDTGIGMSKAQLKAIGVPFYTTKVHGTGLGMVVVLSIIKLMNGQISYTSKMNKGTHCVIQFHPR
ncbi:ATP-binding protein [Paenibacillus sp. SI8]|uniref:ATP-binding protein n=1 Tax=unclassified Paenibacillus TaxID=185978 RepID=UPI00346577B2